MHKPMESLGGSLRYSRLDLIWVADHPPLRLLAEDAIWTAPLEGVEEGGSQACLGGSGVGGREGGGRGAVVGLQPRSPP